MKKTILLTLTILTSLWGFTQNVKFGVFIDPQITWLSPEATNVHSDGTLLGLNGGLSIDRYFQDNYALSTGISTGFQGGKLLFDDRQPIENADGIDTLPAGTTLKYRLNYLSVPLGLKLKSNEIGYFTFFVNLGFTGQINIKALGTSNDSPVTLDKAFIKEEIGLFNVGYYIGGGTEYSLGKDTSVSLGLIYTDGFADITSSSPRVTSRTLSLRVGIIF